MAYTDYQYPEDWLSGYVLVPDSFANAGDTGLNTDKAYICIPIDNSEAAGAGLGNLTEAEAAAATGDVRKVIYELCQSFYNWYNGIASGSEPDEMTVTRSSLVETSTSGKSTRTYSIKVNLDTGSLDVYAE